MTEREPQHNPAELFDRLIDWDTSLTPRDEFLEKVQGEEALRVKFGADITAPTLHLGHAVNLRVMREMQDQGHKVVFLLGGFTTLVGDPTDKLQTRDTPDLENMEENKAKFVEQVGTILDLDDPDVIEIRDNTEWWGGIDKEATVSPLELFRLLGDVTLSKLQSRDMFKRRQEQGIPIQMSEFLYPVLQGYDSVMIESDVTVVGSDQLFNESLGRDFQERAGQNKQMIVCTKVTPGLDGGPKQSKSQGNYVGIAHPPQEKYSRLMRLKDSLTGEWLRVYSDLSLSDIETLEVEHASDPIGLKQELAHNVTAMFHGEETADLAADAFMRNMKKQLPVEVPELTVPAGESLRRVLMEQLGHKAGAVRQLVEQGSIAKIDIADNSGDYSEAPLTEEDIRAAVTPGMIVKIGKRRHYRIVQPLEDLDTQSDI